jgi:hypothetical protein
VIPVIVRALTFGLALVFARRSTEPAVVVPNAMEELEREEVPTFVPTR